MKDIVTAGSYWFRYFLYRYGHTARVFEQATADDQPARWEATAEVTYGRVKCGNFKSKATARRYIVDYIEADARRHRAGR